MTPDAACAQTSPCSLHPYLNQPEAMERNYKYRQPLDIDITSLPPEQLLTGTDTPYTAYAQSINEFKNMLSRDSSKRDNLFDYSFSYLIQYQNAKNLTRYSTTAGLNTLKRVTIVRDEGSHEVSHYL